MNSLVHWFTCSPEIQTTRPNHHTDNDAATTASSAPMAPATLATMTVNRLTGTRIGSGPLLAYAHDPHGNMTGMPHLPVMRWDERGCDFLICPMNPEHACASG